MKLEHGQLRSGAEAPWKRQTGKRIKGWGQGQRAEAQAGPRDSPPAAAAPPKKTAAHRRGSGAESSGTPFASLLGFASLR